MADLYEQWIGKAEGRKGQFIKKDDITIFIGGPGGGAGGSSGSGGSSDNITSSNNMPIGKDFYGRDVYSPESVIGINAGNNFTILSAKNTIGGEEITYSNGKDVVIKRRTKPITRGQQTYEEVESSLTKNPKRFRASDITKASDYIKDKFGIIVNLKSTFVENGPQGFIINITQ